MAKDKKDIDTMNAKEDKVMAEKKSVASKRISLSQIKKETKKCVFFTNASTTKYEKLGRIKYYTIFSKEKIYLINPSTHLIKLIL